MKRFFIITLALLIGSPVLFAHAADVPFIMNYQGSVKTSGGTPYNGNGYFKFAIVNPAGDTAYWSNDGSTSDGTEPNPGSTGIPVAVSNGLFSVGLGDTSFTNMSALSDSVFDNTSTYVRTWFSDDDETFTQLSPDQRILSAAYAIKAQDVATGQKMCIVEGWGPVLNEIYKNSIPVPSSWSAATCQAYTLAVVPNPIAFSLACIFKDNFSIGAFGGGIPSPNCGW